MKIGLPHPDPVVETSSMASVQPPNVYYRLSIPEAVIDRRQLSALQLEAITYACQQHETMLLSGERAGYLIGKMTRSRTLALFYRYIVLSIPHFGSNLIPIVFNSNLPHPVKLPHQRLLKAVGLSTVGLWHYYFALALVT